MADRARVGWVALNVVSAASETLSEADKDRRAEALRLAESLGAEIATLNAESDIAEEILAFARSRNVSRLLIGRPRRRGWLAWLSRETVAEALVREAVDFEVTLVSPEARDAGASVVSAARVTVERDPKVYAWATAVVALATGAAWSVDRLLPVASLSLIFLTGVIFVATRHGLWPSLYAATLSFLGYNFLFTDPRLTFHMAQQEDVLTLVLFYVAAVLTGNLAGQLRQRAEALRASSEQTNTLYDFSRKMTSAATFDDVVWAAVTHVSATLKCDSLLLAPDEGGRLAIVGAFPPEDRLDVRDRSAADWAWERGEPAGRGSATLPSSRWLFLPVGTRQGRLGVLGIAWDDARTLAAGAAPAARPPGRPGRDRDRAHPPRRRPRADPGPLRDRAAARGAALLGQPRPAHAAGLASSAPPAASSRPTRSSLPGSAASSPRRSRRRASG